MTRTVTVLVLKKCIYIYISIKTTLKYRFETCLIGLFGPHFVLFSKKNEGNFH